MRIKLGGLAVFSLIIFMIIPVYADVDIVKINPETFTIDDKFTISGTVSDAEKVLLVAVIRGPGDEKPPNKNIFSDDGVFSFISIDAGLVFKTKGTYTITVFTEKQSFDEGTIIKIGFEKGVATLLPDYILELKEIGNKNVDETKKLSFTASVTDSTIEILEYSLERNPSGSTINKDTGVFSWTPTDTQSGNYILDIVVKSGPLEDRETITVTVNDKPALTPKAEQTTTKPKELGIASFVDETKDPQSYVDRYNNEASYKKWFDDNFSEYDSIYQAVGLKEQLEIPASFVDETKDPQSYVDRYNNEASYKKWFDDNFPKYFSIYEAVGLEEPKVIAAFVDPNLDPQYYVDRYNKEITYKNWFDRTYPDITIYDAVGLEEPKVIEPEFGECGEGTKLIDGKCTIVESKGGGCLIATAAYGSEMAPQVQFLREIRDNQLMSTSSGTAFMTAFNQFYYSFSPYIADMERENPMFQEAVKMGLTPLLSSLSIISFAESESEVLGYGIGVILANIGMYFVAPAMLFYGIRKVRRVRF